MVTDRRGQVLHCTDRAERALGCRGDEVRGRRFLHRFFPGSTPQKVVKDLSSERFGGPGRLVCYPTSLRRADGRDVPVSLWASTLLDADGELATLWRIDEMSTTEAGAPREAAAPRGLQLLDPGATEKLAELITSRLRTASSYLLFPVPGMFFFFNIMAQQLIRRELQLADTFLWNIIQSSVDAIVATDTKGFICIFNDAAERLLSYRAEELVGKAKLSQVLTEERTREVMDKIDSADHGGKGRLRWHEMEIRDRSGTSIPVRLKASVVSVAGFEFATVFFISDRREQIRMRQELERAQVQLLQSEKMASLGKLAAGIAHQINNPLGGIVLFSNLLLEDPDILKTPKWETDVRRIATDAGRCSSIVKEVLEFARQTGDVLKPVDLNCALTQTIFLLEKQPLFHNIEVVEDFCTEPVVHAEPQQLNHVLMNLILNAAEAMDGQGRLTLRTRPCRDDEAFEVRVEDTGPGIPDEIRSQVFEPFFTTKPVGKGTGLGLSVVYGIVERHQGEIRIESTAGEGAAFTVTFPVGKGE